MPTFKLAAFKADGRENIPALSPKPLLSASRENSNTGKKGEVSKTGGKGIRKLYFQCRREPLSGVPCSAMGVLIFPQEGKACGTARICRLRTKAQVTLEFLYAGLQAEGGDALTLQVNDAAAMKKVSTASGCAELNFYGMVNPSGTAGRTEFPGAADLSTRTAGAEHPLGSHQQNCSAIPTSGLPGAVQSLGVQLTPGRWITLRAGANGLLSCERLSVLLWWDPYRRQLQKQGRIPGSKQPKFDL